MTFPYFSSVASICGAWGKNGALLENFVFGLTPKKSPPPKKKKENVQSATCTYFQILFASAPQHSLPTKPHFLMHITHLEPNKEYSNIFVIIIIFVP